MAQTNRVSGLQDLPYNLSEVALCYSLRDLPHELFPCEPGILPIPVTAYHESWREAHTRGVGELLPSVG